MASFWVSRLGCKITGGTTIQVGVGRISTKPRCHDSRWPCWPRAKSSCTKCLLNSERPSLLLRAFWNIFAPGIPQIFDVVPGLVNPRQHASKLFRPKMLQISQRLNRSWWIRRMMGKKKVVACALTHLLLQWTEEGTTCIVHNELLSCCRADNARPPAFEKRKSRIMQTMTLMNPFSFRECI